MNVASRLVVTVVAIAGCQVVGDRDPATLADRVAAARDRMHVRFAAAKAAQVAIAVGDLDSARASAGQIAALVDPDILPEWRPYLDDIRAAAARTAASADPVVAAKAMAQLGRDCARCHEATDAKIAFAIEPPPAETGRLAAQMTSHQWAAARMWEGLIGPSTERWLAGARVLAGASLTITAEGGELGIADDAARAKLLARRAIEVGAPSDRAALYGELLATCADCHAKIRDRTLPTRSQP